MRADEQAAIWDEVWAEYDARQAGRAAGQAATAHPDRAAPEAPAPFRTEVPPVARTRSWDGERLLKAARQRPRVRPVVQAVLSLLTGLVLLGVWLALPWLLAVRLSVPIGQGDAPALLRQFDGPAAMASLRAGLVAQVPAEESEGARRFLTGMAERMADSWERPEGLQAWLALRGRGTRREGSAVSLATLRSARPVGLATFRLEYGTAREEGGVAFDLAWQGDGFRVTGLRFLEATALAGPAAPGPLLAMR